MRGMLHIYCGEGKGKTTCAAGLAFRAAARGKNVCFAQFMKGGESGETEAMKKFENIRVLKCSKEYPFFGCMSDEDKKSIRKEHNEILENIFNLAEKNSLIVLDEISYAVNFELCDATNLDRVLGLLDFGTEIVFTGRNMPQKFMEKADYITEMKKIRHPFDMGAEAREGIEY